MKATRSGWTKSGRLIAINLLAIGLLGLAVSGLSEGNDSLKLAIAASLGVGLWFAVTICMLMFRFIKIAAACIHESHFSVDPAGDIMDGIRSLPEELKKNPMTFFKQYGTHPA